MASLSLPGEVIRARAGLCDPCRRLPGGDKATGQDRKPGSGRNSFQLERMRACRTGRQLGKGGARSSDSHDSRRVFACLLCLAERVLRAARADAGSGASSVSTDVSNDSAMTSCPGAASPLSLGSRNASPEGAKPEPAVSQRPP